ncbi:unnamed protein product [Prunus brigantina]
MAQEVVNSDEVVLGEEIDHVRLITLNKPRHLNVISSKVVCSQSQLVLFKFLIHFLFFGS